MPGDPFDTAAIRRRVLDAWAASPARFREDANAEDDLVRGAYRDRVVVELAQNAADAAARAGQPGRLWLRLAGRQLVASNTGAPLDPEGAESLSSLRASAKRPRGAADDPTGSTHDALAGRFGVGFAAVLAVTDEPRIASSTGALRWSAPDAREVVAAVPALAGERRWRHGQLPVLRLPWADSARPEPGWTTTVRLPLRDADAVGLVHRLLGEVDDALLLALPALAEVTVEVDGAVRRVAGTARWHVVRRAGALEPLLLADRPVEERDRPWWSLTWALPRDGAAVPGTVHAPTPTDEPLHLPALLIASFPLDPGRRHVAPGALTDFLVGQAAAAYADLAAQVAQPLELVPAPMAVGWLDGAVRAAIMAALSAAPLLRTSGGQRVHPRDAVVVPGAGPALRSVLGEVLDAVVAGHPALRRLGVRELDLADVVDLLAALDRAPAWWHRLYTALSETAPAEAARDATVRLESLGALPVPLADGRTVRGARGLLMAGDGVLPAGLEVLGLRVVHPGAAHPLLARLGAAEPTAGAVLEQPEVGAAVDGAWDHPDPAAVADAVLGLVTAAGVGGGAPARLRELPLPDDEGELAAAGELVLPGSLLDRVADPEAVGRPAPGLLARWGPAALAAVGVLAGFAVVRDEDVLLDLAAPQDSHDLHDEPGWVRAVAAALPAGQRTVVVAELLAVRDLDVVRDDAWGSALAAIAADRELRGAVTEPTWVLLEGGGRAPVPPYAAWWLRVNARLHGQPPTSYAVSAASDLAGLYDQVPADLAGAGIDEALLEAIGVRTSLASLLASPEGPDDLLDRLADPGRDVSDESLGRIYAALARLGPDGLAPPRRVRLAARELVAAADAVVLDSAAHLQLVWPAPPLVVALSSARDLAAVLDLDTTSSRLGHIDVTGGDWRATPEVVTRVLPGSPEGWFEHDELVVRGQPVDWWTGAAGQVHACTVDGLARGLAWSAGRWDRRLLLAAVLETPARLDQLLVEARLEGRGDLSTQDS